MSDKHFTLDVDPEGLRAVATQVGELREHLQTKGGRAQDIPEEIGEDWTGDAASYVMGEMRALGLLMDWRLGAKLQPVPGALRTLAGHFDDALGELPSLNRRWEEAENAYDDAVTAADQTREDSQEASTEAGRTNAFYRNEIDKARTNALSTASGAKSSTQDALEVEYDDLVAMLQRKVGNLATALTDSAPVDVSQEQIEQWRTGEGPEIDRSDLLFTLSLTRQREELLDLEERREQAGEDSAEDIQDLYSALDDNDTDGVADALDEIGGHSDDEVYSDALLEHLGPEGVRDLYREINRRSNDDELGGAELYDNLENFSDTIAHGISRTDESRFNDFYDTLTEDQEDTRILALIAASDRADGRLNTAAMSVHRSALSYPTSLDSESEFFIMALQEAYDGENLGTDAVEQWVERSNAEDLAAVLKGFDSRDEVDEFMYGFNPSDLSGGMGGTVGVYGDEIPKQLATRYGQVLDQLRDEHLDILGEDPTSPHHPLLLLHLLNERENLSSGGMNYYADELDPYIRGIVEGPRFVSWYLANLGEDETSRPHLQDLLRESDADVSDLISSLVNHGLSQGQNPDDIARSLGNMLRADDLAGEDFNANGVIESLAKDGISAIARTPVTGPILNVFSAIAAEQGRIDEIYADAEDDELKALEQEIMGFQLYVSVNGEPPPGFNDWAERHGVEDDPKALTDYINVMRSQEGHPGLVELEGYIERINTGRDDT